MIRPAELQDLDDLYLLCQVEPFIYDINNPQYYDINWLEELIKNYRCITLVYESNNIVKGFIAGERLVYNGAILWMLSVKKEYRNNIIGVRLYQEFEKYCKKAGITWLLSYGYKTSEEMLRKGDFRTNENNYLEFYKDI